MIRHVFLFLGTLLLGLLLWRLGPTEILRMAAQLGWHSLPILIFYGLYQALRAAALKLSILRWRQVPFADAFGSDPNRRGRVCTPFAGRAVPRLWSLLRVGPVLLARLPARPVCSELRRLDGSRPRCPTN